ncbi:MAG: protein-tyrosine phosphatase [Verrucomicrobiales bacterium]|jgi:protein-tyrosine phosphatase
MLDSGRMPYRILFVCLGNICRSPSGENIMNAVLQEAGLAQAVICDSAGTIDVHRGKGPDPRMCQAAAEHGYTFRGAARQVTTQDLETQDLILAMDRDNLTELRALAGAGEHHAKMELFANYCTGDQFPDEVPDPYYGGEEGFHEVITMVENGCQGLLKHVKKIL